MCMQSWSRAVMLGNSFPHSRYVFWLQYDVKSKFFIFFEIVLGEIHGDLLAVHNVLEDEQEEMVLSKKLLFTCFNYLFFWCVTFLSFDAFSIVGFQW
jgi:hypothetical protein